MRRFLVDAIFLIMSALAQFKLISLLIRSAIVGMLMLTSMVHADVVKPALIEISVHKDGQLMIEVRASIEALLTGINAKYKNTQSSPMAEAYDALRALSAEALEEAFHEFEQEYLSEIQLIAEQPGEKQPGPKLPVELRVATLDIPEPGYTKVPRISTLWLNAEIPRDASRISLRYPTKFSDYAVRVRQVDEAAEKWHWSEWDWVRSSRESQSFSLNEIYAKRTTLETISQFVTLGFLHILPRGLDHILFILGLFLFCRSMRPLLWQVTMFTLAHTVTLGLATAGYIELSPRIVEPLIALSIAYVGIENIFATRLHRHRLVLVFGFGLLHGLGFASVLSEFDLPEDAFFTSLLSFNVGVEFGQLSIITVAWLALGWLMKFPWYRRRVIIPGSLIISMTGLLWTFERLNFS